MANAVRLLLVFFLLFVSQGAYSQNHKFEWLDYSSETGTERNYDILVEPNGNNYTVGFFDNDFDIDPSAGVQLLTSAGGSDCFVRKLDRDKNLIWSYSFGSDSNEELFSVEQDFSGDLILTGMFRDTLDFDPTIDVFEMSVSEPSFFINKIDSSGSFIWATQILNAFGFNPINGSIPNISTICDTANNIYVVGRFQDSMIFSPNSSPVGLYGTGFQNGFIAKYDSNGTLQWAKQFEGMNTFMNDVSIDSEGDILVAGGYSISLDADPGVGVTNLSSPTISGVVIKLDSNGDLIWSRSIDGGQFSAINHLHLGVNDTIYLYGTFEDTVDFDPGLGTFEMISYNLGSLWSQSVHLTKWTPDGNFVWAISFGNEQQEISLDILLDESNNIYLTGAFDFIMDFDASPASTYNILAINFSDNTFFVSYDREGVFRWAKALTDYAGKVSLASDSSNALYMAGSWGASNLDFNMGEQILSLSSNAADQYLMKYEPCVPSATTDTVLVCNGNSYTWINGFTYNSDNTSAKMVLEAANGCDSIVSLNLTFSNPTSSSDVITACNSYTWIDGITYTSSNNSATQVFSNVTGCDSTVTLNLTIIPSDTTFDNINSCGPYTWIDGNTYASSNNTAEVMYTNINNCDSVLRLNLTVNTPTSGTDIVSACESFIWIDGNNYTSSNNSATFMLTNSAGCDSLVTLDLTVLPATSGTDVITACDSYTWIDGATYTSSNSSAQEVLLNNAGCDSTVTLDLTINNSTSYTDIIAACDSFTWIDGNSYTASNNSAIFILSNTAGCDSVITLDLTLNNATANVTPLDPQLVAAVGATSYQWLDCLNGNTPIAGETSNVFIATTNGEYAVAIVENGCTDTSACFVINNVSLVDLPSKNWSVFPNPTQNTVMIQFEESFSGIVEVTDASGRRIEKISLNGAVETQLELGEERGIYFVRVQSQENEEVVSVVKL